MHESRCFLQSNGKLGCTSCHDPHAVPAADQKVNHYRSRCLECHDQKPCHLPEHERLATSPENNCALCHMPKVSSSNVAHNSITDHRIRVPGRKAAEGGKRDLASSGPLVHFHQDRVGIDDTETARDRGIALTRSVLIDLRRPAENAEARRLLERAAQMWPDDVDAWCALGLVHQQQGRHAEALAAYQRALAEIPNHELALRGAAISSADQEQAVQYWKNLIGIDPWRSSYHSQLAAAYMKSKQWALAADEYHSALQLNPANLDDRKGLVRCLTRQGKHDEARAQLQKWMAMQPAGASRDEP
jgi:predicted CXXCH cytochrome family protein